MNSKQRRSSFVSRTAAGISWAALLLLQSCACSSGSSPRSSAAEDSTDHAGKTELSIDASASTTDIAPVTSDRETSQSAPSRSMETGLTPTGDTNHTSQTEGHGNTEVSNTAGESSTRASTETDASSEDVSDSGTSAAKCGDWACFPMPNVAAVPSLPESYDVSQAGVVLDEVTGIMWQTQAAATTLKAIDALTACDGLELAGHSDWRLPTLMELLSLIDHASDAPGGTAKTTSAFVDGGPYAFWSSTTQGSPTALWLAHLAGGDVDAPSANASARVRCARTHEVRATAAEHYTAFGSDGEGWVRDNWTSLEWHADATASEFTFVEAQQYCTESTTDGGGWRAPSARELMTLVDVHSAELLKIDGTFFRGTQRETWTSSPSVLLDDAAWFVDFRLGRVVDLLVTGDDLVNSEFSVRCTR
jgi:Protein of unknown function (DUF1566)